MLMNKKTLALSVLAASLVSAPAMAELSGNISATSNYIWRGVTQNGDESAVQGGIDYSHESGFYAGTWTSSLGGAGDYELDLYAGYGFEAAGIAFDAGVINYMYPIDTDGAEESFYEVYLGGSMGDFSAKVSYSPDAFLADDVDESSIYLEAAYTAGLFTFHVGSYDFDYEDAEDYVDYSVSLAKDEFTFGISNTDLEDDDPRVFVTYSKDFAL